MEEKKQEEQSSFIVRFIMELLSPGANKASMIILNITMLLVWFFILLSLYYKYYNIHVYIIGILTTCLVLFVNYFSKYINEAIPKEEEKEDLYVCSKQNN